jgi:hypothetical protein
MATPLSGFGKFLKLKGKSWNGDSTAVPLPLLQNLKTNTPIPIVQTASTFVVNAGVTAPVNIWNGNDFIQLKETLTYTWATTAQAMINSSGATVAATVSGATVYYFYIAQDTAGAYQLAPSPTYPRYVEGPYEGGWWTHPGTSRTKYWNYVGWQLCTATTPVMLKMEKEGFLYHNPTPTACGVVGVAANITVAAAETLANLVPVHNGVELSGWASGVTEGPASYMYFGSTSLAAKQFTVQSVVPTLSVVAGVANFGPMTVQGSGATFWAYGNATFTNGGALNVTVIKDVV